MSDIPILTPKTNDPPASDALQAFDKKTSFLGEKLNGLSGSLKETATSLSSSVLGDTSFITRPFKQFAELSKKTFGLFAGKKNKVRPKREDLLKHGAEGAGSVFIVDWFKKIFGKGDGEKKSGVGGLMAGLGATSIGKMASRVFPGLMKAMPIAALAAGLIWGVIDGIKATMLAGEWGTSKVEAFLGGFLGGTGSGWKNAFKNAGKWALIGAGSGFLIAGPPGAIAGGLIGAAIGGLLGFIGGERIAQFFNGLKDSLNAIWEKFKETKTFDFLKETFASLWDFIKSPFVGLIEQFTGVIDRVKAIFKTDESIGKKIGRLLVEVVTFVPRLIFGWTKGLVDGFIGLVKDIFVGKKDKEGKRTRESLAKRLIGALKEVGSAVTGFVVDLAEGAWEGIQTLVVGAVDFAGKANRWIIEYVQTPIENFFKDMFSGIKEGVGDVVSTVTTWTQNKIIQPITSVFWNTYDAIRAKTSSIIATVKTWTQQKIIDPVATFFSDAFSAIGSVFGKGYDIVSGWLNQYIADPIRNAFSHISDFFSNLAAIWQQEVRIDQKLADLLYFSTGGALGGRKSGARLGEEGLGIVSTVDDAIIRPDGSIVRTDPRDTIIATKNDAAIMGEMAMAQKAMNDSSVDRLITAVNSLGQSMKQGTASPIVQTNIIRRYDPENIMSSLAAAVP